MRDDGTFQEMARAAGLGAVAVVCAVLTASAVIAGGRVLLKDAVQPQPQPEPAALILVSTR